MEELIEMSKKELDRLQLLQKVLDRQLTQKKAAEVLKLSERQVRNLLSRLKKEGPKALISKKRGVPSNRTFHHQFRAGIMNIIKERYPDFGPKLATEKLLEIHSIKISVETLRKWMIRDRIWFPKQKKNKLYPPRLRKECFGELIQIDVSHHAWFEERAEKCALVVFVDDATSAITSMKFCKGETLEGYFITLKDHLKHYGRPLAIYSDRHAIFGGGEGKHKAQFVRALNELNIEHLLASSPQAKGRVERANQTLQDRLIKEMRLRNISNIEEGNNFLSDFIEEYNRKFSKEPRGQIDAHRPLDAGYDLERSLTRCEIRTLSKDLSFSFYNKKYQILESSMINRLRNKQIEIRQKMDGTIRVFYKDIELRFIRAEEFIDEYNILENKKKMEWKSRGHSQTIDHPWKRYDYDARMREQRKQWAMV